MHLHGFGEAYRLARQPFDPRTPRQMFPLNLLGVALARLVFIRLDMTRVGAPIVCGVSRYPTWLQKRFALEKHCVLATPENVSQHLATTVIDRMPKPPRLCFALHKRPHLIHFCFASPTDDDFHIA